MGTEPIPLKRYVTVASYRAPIILAVAAVYSLVVGLIDPQYAVFPPGVFIAMAFLTAIPVFYASRIFTSNRAKTTIYARLMLFSAAGFTGTLTSAIVILAA